MFQIINLYIVHKCGIIYLIKFVAKRRLMALNHNTRPKGTGWDILASVLLVISGLLHLMEGLVALYNNNVYLVTEKALVAFNFTAWGWIHIILSIILLTAASSVLVGGYWGRTIGVIVASLSIVANMAFMSSYPIWSIVMITIDSFIIYALILRAGALRQQ